MKMMKLPWRFWQKILIVSIMIGILFYIKAVLFVKKRVHDVMEWHIEKHSTALPRQMLVKYDLIPNDSQHSRQNERLPMTNLNKFEKPNWIQKLEQNHAQRRNYFLVEVLKVRIYAQDKAKWTIKELKQWIHYMLWAGVEHIFLCDHYQSKDEILSEQLRKYIDLKLVTYLPFPEPRISRQAQILCYNTILADYKSNVEWQMSVDMDEYPFVHGDVQEGFLVRYLKNIRKDIVEVTMPNFLMLGRGDRHKDMVIERINRIRSLNKRSNDLSKSIYRARNISAVDIHAVNYKAGYRYFEFGNKLKNLHYWGARLQDWGPDTNQTLGMTVEFNEVRDKLGPIIRNSLFMFGETDAFSNNTGP